MIDISDGCCDNCKYWTFESKCLRRNNEITAKGTHCGFWEEGRHPTRPEIEEETKPDTIRQLNRALAEGVPPVQWIVENIVRRGGITILGGPSGSFKSWFAMEICLSCATNYRFIGEFSTEKVKVLYVDEEMGDLVILNRFKSLAKGNQLNKDQLTDVSLSVFNNFKLDNEEIIIRVERIIRDYDPQLIIFDSMVRCMQGDEDKSSEVRKIFDNLKELFNVYDVSFILLHHTAKGAKGLNALRGSGDFAGFADVVLMFNKLPNGKVKVDFSKNRHIDTNKLQNFTFSIDSDEEERSARLKFECFNIENVTERDRCIEAYITYLRDNKLTEFKAGTVINELKSQGFSFYLIDEVRKHLLNIGIISDKSEKNQRKRGYYYVNQNQVLDDKIGIEDVD